MSCRSTCLCQCQQSGCGCLERPKPFVSNRPAEPTPKQKEASR